MGAKRLECAQLAAAFGRAGLVESGSKPTALQTLRDFQALPSRIPDVIKLLAGVHQSFPSAALRNRMDTQNFIYG